MRIAVWGWECEDSSVGVGVGGEQCGGGSVRRAVWGWESTWGLGDYTVHGDVYNY